PGPDAPATSPHGTPDRDLCFVADLRLGETVRAGGDHAARLRTIQAACGQIANLWPTIREPDISVRGSPQRGTGSICAQNPASTLSLTESESRGRLPLGIG